MDWGHGTDPPKSRLATPKYLVIGKWCRTWGGPISWPKPKWRRFWSPTHVSDRAQPIITSYNHHSGACNEIEMQSEVDRTQVSKRVFFSSVCFIGCFIELLLRSFDFSLRCKEGILGGGCARLRFWHGRSRCCPRISI